MSVALAFESMGEGPPVVILHGLFGSGRNWKPFAQALAQRHRVILPDACNHGASPWSDDMSYTAMARDVLTFIERERLHRPVLVGHSMGGKTAMALALTHPDAIAGIAVIDIAPVTYPDQFSPYVAALRGLDLASASRRKEIRRALAVRPGPDAPLDLLIQNVRNHEARFDWRLNLMATALCMPDLCGFPAALMGERYTGPALFVAGGDSDYVRPDADEAIRRMFKQARVERIADAGHWVHADAPQALQRLLQGWLGGLPLRRAALRVLAEREPV
ncbi:alpha/beta fold hydrolase [Ramlibacter sp. WS9]|uniref:alpha/beta fold hydrolase n=1 Tax=Ramlibacter sp. WS9 TaxID=1882741 RepID=UPI0011412AD2|nr:alpha/beta fold hydrolase [Ramlibacter sp. WS9]ROZ75091.1 alpha/beta fold hydrolase [Ramlibacter sp. WS9]